MLPTLIPLAVTDWSPVTVPMLHALGGLAALLFALGIRYLASKVKNDGRRAVIERVAEFMYTEVTALTQAELPLLEHVAGTLRLRPADAEALRKTAIARVKENLGPDGIRALNAATGNRSIDDYLLSLLESTVASTKGMTLPSAPPSTVVAPKATVAIVETSAPVPPPVPRGAAGFVTWAAVLMVALLAAGLFLATAVQGCSAPQQRHDATAAVVTAGGIVSGLYTASRVSYHVGTDALRARGLTGPAYAAAVAPLNATYRARTRTLGSLDSCVYSGAEIIDNASDPNVGLASSASASQVIDCINAALPELTSGDVLPAIPIPPQLLQFVAVLNGFANGAGLNTMSDAGGQ